MEPAELRRIQDFIWNIADDVLRDIYSRGKYRDVILPMTVLRRLDAVLEPTKGKVRALSAQLDKAGVSNKHAGLCGASGQAFYNSSPFTLKGLKSAETGQQHRRNFEAYLDGFSDNVREILDKFNFRNQIPKLVEANILGLLIEKFLDPDINLSPEPVRDLEGHVVLPGLDNHAMGTVFEELIRRFNEENNEEAGEHFTPRDVVRLMAKLMFVPVADQIESGTYLLYDGACGTGGMLTVAEGELYRLAEEHGKQVSIHLYGQEINPETYAICKADLLIKGEGLEAEHIVGGVDMSTLSNDAFPRHEFDFMLSNPPYGKSWKSDLTRLGGEEGKSGISDPRFVVDHAGDPSFKLATRSSDGQLMFLVNKLSKMKKKTPLGSRIALVHNGSALFTGDAGQGESNIRRWVLENDWLEAIIALPLNMFYNTGIATYIWVLTNRKARHRRGKVQLIDASEWSQPLRRNYGKKNCELGTADIERILTTLQAFDDADDTSHSKVFDNEAFGYWKITVERPLRLRSQFKRASIEGLRFASGDDGLRRELYERFGQSLYEEFARIRTEMEHWLRGDDSEADEESSPRRKAVPEKRRRKLLDVDAWQRDLRLVEAARRLAEELGSDVFPDFNLFRERVDGALEALGIKLSPAEKKILLRAVSWRDEAAPPVIAKRIKTDPATDPAREALYGNYYADAADDAPAKGQRKAKAQVWLTTFEPDPELRDTEQVPLQEAGGIEAFFKREVQPFAPDAWIDADSTKIGYEISFARHFYRPKPMRTLEEIRRDILALERQTEGLLKKIVGDGA
ncbi:MAG TPA: class I SAM-dependent DNA methyltransferase [Methylococcaceae bacterium]|nr:class I SAM-dependent DNA methyltransferase [Methylococcaceae bacterium]